eukprot:sb/3476182/
MLVKMDHTLMGQRAQHRIRPTQPIRARYLGHVTGYQPIRDQYFLIRSVPGSTQHQIYKSRYYVRIYNNQSSSMISNESLNICFSNTLSVSPRVYTKNGIHTTKDVCISTYFLYIFANKT